MPSLPLSGKSALVTGGARRLGRAIAIALAEAGADVTLTYLASADDAAKTVASIEKLGRKAQAVRCDVRDEEQVCATVANAAEFHGRLDVVVNNSAIFERGQLASMTVAQWDAIFATNTRGPFLVAREALPHLRSSSGRIINIGSLGGVRPWADHAHYCASKAALHMLTQTMAKAFAPEVCVNCVAPGWIAMEDSDTDAAVHFAAKTPLHRNGTAVDVTQAVVYFATNNGFVTGQILAVDGGLGL